MLGQDEQVLALARSVAEGSHAHAYLLSGPPRSGKGTLARRLAQALNCTGRADEPGPAMPCGVCRSCRHIEDGKHPDVEVITVGGICGEADHDHRKDNSKEIKICQVRALERRLSLSPFEGRYRVIIVDGADAMNVYAADAFLKTLEEPPPSVVIALVTAKEEALPETVRSRLRPIEVRPAPIALLEAALNEIVAAHRGDVDGSPIDTALVARLSRGRTGWALSVLADPTILAERGKKLDRIVQLGAAGLDERFAHAAELAASWTRDRKGVTAMLSLWTEWWRDVLLSVTGAERGILNIDRMEQIRPASAGLSAAAVAGFLQALRDSQSQLEENANPRLALEVLMLRLPEARVAI